MNPSPISSRPRRGGAAGRGGPRRSEEQGARGGARSSTRGSGPEPEAAASPSRARVPTLCPRRGGSPCSGPRSDDREGRLGKRRGTYRNAGRGLVGKGTRAAPRPPSVSSFSAFRLPSPRGSPRPVGESRERGQGSPRAEAGGRDSPRSELRLGPPVSHPRPAPSQGLAVPREAAAQAAAPLPPRPRQAPAPPHLPRRRVGLGVLPRPPPRHPAPLGSLRPVGAQPAKRRRSHWLHVLPLMLLRPIRPQGGQRASRPQRGCLGQCPAVGCRFPPLFSSLRCARLTEGRRENRHFVSSGPSHRRPSLNCPRLSG